MDTRICNLEVRAKVAPNLVNNQLIADANTMPTEGHTTVAETNTMSAEPYTMAAEQHTLAAERCNFLSISSAEGHTTHTMATRRRIESTIGSN